MAGNARQAGVLAPQRAGESRQEAHVDAGVAGSSREPLAAAAVVDFRRVTFAASEP